MIQNKNLNKNIVLKSTPTANKQAYKNNTTLHTGKQTILVETCAEKTFEAIC